MYHLHIFESITVASVFNRKKCITVSPPRIRFQNRLVRFFGGGVAFSPFLFNIGPETVGTSSEQGLVFLFLYHLPALGWGPGVGVLPSVVSIKHV